MKFEMNLGSVPCDENCVQVGAEHYELMARSECERWIKTLRLTLGDEPEGCRLKIKSFPHDFGSYLEVVCVVQDDTDDAAMNYAFKCESNAPTKWVSFWEQPQQLNIDDVQIPLLE